MALLLAWAGDVPEDIESAQLQVRFAWQPANTTPAPLSVLPLPLDVDFGAATSDAYDLPPGVSEKAFEFTAPGSGRILAIGGHLHDNGLSLRLEDVATGRVVVELRPKLDRDGHVIGMPTQLPGVSGDGILVRAGRTYRVVARYDNPASETLINGAMGVMVALFAPDSFGQWPLVAAGRTDLAEDARGLAGLHVVGAMPLARADPRPR